jgi:dolichol-phosphate mannosyltransferase
MEADVPDRISSANSGLLRKEVAHRMIETKPTSVGESFIQEISHLPRTGQQVPELKIVPQLSILLPVRNEGINLQLMLKILRAVVDVPHEVLVIHDDVQDDSIAVARALQGEYPSVRIIHNTRGRGVVHAITSGVEEAQGEFVLIFAADEVGPVLAIQDMLTLLDEGCDFISCTRYAHGGRRLGGSFIGGILSRVANQLFSTVCGSQFTDCTTGIKMFRRSVFEQIRPQAKPIGWAVTFEMAIRAELAELTLGEVPIVSIDRLYGGTSSFRLGPWFVEYLRWFIWGASRLAAARRTRRHQVASPRRHVGSLGTGMGSVGPQQSS